MSEQVLILGRSGSGKSTSIENLDPEKTAVINVVGKSMPFKGWKRKYNVENKNYYASRSYSDIILVINRFVQLGKEVIVLDDVQYLMSGEFMDKAKISGWDKYTDMAANFYNLIEKTIKPISREKGVYFFLLGHTDESDQNNIKMKTIGKLLDEKIIVEGLFTIVLFAEGRITENKPLKYFRTQGLGNDSCKSPRGMFEEMEIPNDLNYVLTKIKEYEGEE